MINESGSYSHNFINSTSIESCYTARKTV